MDHSMKPLPDMFYRLFGNEPNGYPGMGNWVQINIIAILSITAFRAIYHRRRLDILRRFFIVGSFLYIFRGFCIIATSLPDPYPPCQTFTVDPNKSLFGQVFSKMYEALKGTGQLDCGDVFFSGHAASLTECCLVFTTYTNNIYMILFMWVYSFVTICLMLGAHFHYTIDILFGFFCTIVFWYYYHYMAHKESLLQYRLWAYLESESIGRSLGGLWSYPPFRQIRRIIPFGCIPGWGGCDVPEDTDYFTAHDSHENDILFKNTSKYTEF